jgi:1-acyl-sn-glycerol-3-phosphate acyltransferase
VLVRSIVFNLAVYVNFLVQAVLFSPVLLLPERMVWPVARFWVRSTLWLHRMILGIDDEIRGREHIPSGGCLVASKHQSAWETLRLVELFPRPTFILKRELLWVPLFGWYLQRTGMIPVDRGKRSAALAAMTARARRAVAEGRQIIIFPEGTRRPPGAPAAYRFGVRRLYAELAVPCLPVALNSGLFWPRRSLVQRRGRIVLACLPVLPPGLPPEAFGARLEDAIETATAELLEEAVRRQPELKAHLCRPAPAISGAPATRGTQDVDAATAARQD